MSTQRRLRMIPTLVLLFVLLGNVHPIRTMPSMTQGQLEDTPPAQDPQRSETTWQSVFAQTEIPEAMAAKLDAQLRLAFRLWHERIRFQSQQTDKSQAIGLRAKIEEIAVRLAERIDLHLDAPEPGANVLIHTTDDARELEKLGIVIQARVGDVATAYIPFSRLPEVTALPSVVFVQASHILQLANDVSVPETGAPQVWNTYGATGTGVIVAVIDSGIDPFHPDFINPDGTTRIKYLLDFSDPGDPDSDGNLNGPVFGGTMYTEAQINAALADPGWFYPSADTPRSIPDNSPSGTTSQIVVSQSVNITSVAVNVYIEHPYIGDLQVVLTCPSGTTITLHNRIGDNRDDIIGTFTVTACNGQSAQGTWRLMVSDHASQDTGSLLFWGLHLNRPVRMTDLHGHGTHVAGTAAGNGRGTNGGLPAGTFKGMAPSANLIVVRATRDYIGGFSTTDILNALTFVDQKAQELGLPYVVNMSLGGHIGPHDGTSPEERAIDNLVGAGKPGKAIVVSAGNEGDEAIHAGGTLSRGRSVALQVNVPSGGGFFLTDIWYEGSDTFGVGFRDPSGSGIDPALVPPGQEQCFTSSTALVCIMHNDNNLYNGDKEILFLIISLSSGTWRLILYGNNVVSGRYDGWIQGCCDWTNPDNQMRVGMPGTARSAITVGAYTTKNRWTDVTGAGQSIPATIGAIAAFSSDGPTRDGRLKPEITAPGQMICSTFSGQSPVGAYSSMYPSTSYVCQDGRHGIAQGTSMSAPHVTGAVALLLSLNRSLDAMQLKELLTRHARSDSFTGTIPNHRWGYGKLDVPAAARAVASPPPATLDIYLPLVLKHYSFASPTPFGWEILVSTDFENEFPGPWRVYDDNDTTNGEYYWGKRNCHTYAGSYSGWAVGAGADGAGLSCGSNYPDDADSVMVYGPFSLVGATAADLNFKLWLNTEVDYDYICRMASINGTEFYGICTAGNSNGWIDRALNLSNVYQLGNLLGQPQVWVLLWFYSDSSVNYPEGAYIDNIVLRKCPEGATCLPDNLPALSIDSRIAEFPLRKEWMGLDSLD
ncbi:MAG: S8 family serine peptidase [Anaerolineae bacterium]|nr:S8 family serine peptidase [Anaerolineae bacterium]MDW8101126.1 S8 family serine peptidase [Anaerolineae bacterium]